MSVEASVQEHVEPVKEEIGLTYCPHCGFKIPDSIRICWNCGERVKK